MQASNPPGWFSFERLEVYHAAVEFRRLTNTIVGKLPAQSADDIDQLKRSSKSIVRNICEGAGEFKRAEKTRFYRIALRSAEESGGTIKILIDDYGEREEYTKALQLLLRIIPMLIALCKVK